MILKPYFCPLNAMVYIEKTSQPQRKTATMCGSEQTVSLPYRKKIFSRNYILLMASSLMASPHNLNSTYYYIFRNLSMIAYMAEIQKSKFTNI